MTTWEELEDWREEYQEVTGKLLPFGLDDDLEKLNYCYDYEMDLADWALVRGVPEEYARMLHAYRLQHD